MTQLKFSLKALNTMLSEKESKVMMKIGVIQLCSQLDYQVNLEKIEKFLSEAKAAACEAVFLPECFYSMSDGQTATPYLVVEGNEHFKNVSNLAAKYEIPLLAGTAASELDGKVINRNFNFDADGKLLNFYDKIHLFSCDIKKGEKKKVINEADIYTAGSEYSLLEFRGLKIGLGICFDLRFSEQALHYRKQGANVLTFPAAFTIPTGKAHWHVLNRARAIENQCFVISPAQWGRHNDKIQTFGHSLVIDPWGNILADGEEGEKLLIADLDLSLVQENRHKIPMRRD